MTVDDLTIQLAAAGLGLSAAGVATWWMHSYISPASRAFLPLISRGDRSSPTVTLTFDDGPRLEGTPQILDILARNRVQAAFFVIGANAARYPDLVRRMDAEGHLICNHTYDHLPLGALRPGRFWREQLKKCDDTIEAIIGRRPAFFRPPLGHKSPRLRRPLRESGHLTVCWSCRGWDGMATTKDKILARMAERARGGDILLLHDGREPWSDRDPAPTVTALEPLIRRIRERGLEFVRLDRMIGHPAYFGTPLEAEAALAPMGEATPAPT